MGKQPSTAAALAQAVADDVGGPVRAMTSLSGGDFAAAYRVDLDDGRVVFAKTHIDPPPHFFTTEAAGLRWLADTATVAVPTVLAAADDGPARLVLTWVSPGPRVGDDEAFGRALAALHDRPWPTFGRPDRRTTGSLALPNEPVADWYTFFRAGRLEPLARLARDRAALSPAVVDRLDAVADRLPDLVPEAPVPSLVHGDLWAGNRIADDRGASWVIDPAAHGNHREWDLAMMGLFGGFGPAVFAAYDEVRPPDEGRERRVALFQLPPLVVHAIKFGGGYAAAVTSALDALGV